jgi:pimeloyl-ACP methyl ester carboxylesterase
VTSEQSPLVLLHPGSSSGRIWQNVVPLLSEHLGVHTPTLLGHLGGPTAQRRPVTLTDIFDSAERYLDEKGLDRPHLAGNSLGGAVAIELARRGRAATVCAISPAGFWSASDGSEKRLLKRLRVAGVIFPLIYPVAPLVLKSAAGRQIILRDLVCHGERLSAAQALDWYFADPKGCTVIDDSLAWRYPEKPLDPLPCPITLAWAEGDRLVPAATCGRTARERLPGATWITLPDVGHNAMVDDPDLVARTVMAVTGVGV